VSNTKPPASSSDRPILPGPVQVLGIDVEGMACIVISRDYSPKYDGPTMFRVEMDDADGFVIWDQTGDTDLTTSLAESDPLLARELIEWAGLVLRSDTSKWLGLTMAAKTRREDRLDA
jgi:hypothetical protein